MFQKPEIRISVRNLVEFILRSGSIDSGFMGSSRALEGTRAHQKIQKSGIAGYSAEVHLSYTVEYQDYCLTVEGRADGIIEVNGSTMIDEIKSTTRPLEYIDENYNPLHWAQAKCYAYIYSWENGLDYIGVQITYYQLDTEEVKQLGKRFHIDELRDFFYDLVEKYKVWADFTQDWAVIRNKSIKELIFPFGSYRKGQRELAVTVYKTIGEKKKLFAQAPTGIGKTMSTLFPAVKAIGEGLTSKIFYLTAKTITRQVAEEAFIKMREKGLECKTVTITAKDKICFKKEAACKPEECEYAAGHFDRVNGALYDILTHANTLDRNLIEEYAKKHTVCPFEYTLDLAIWADCVICDYNYVFDPRVYLKRFFSDNSGDFTFLVDEAHNLVDRAREMFSAQLSKEQLLELKKLTKDRAPKVSKALNKLNSYMLSLKKQSEDKRYFIQKEAPKEVYPHLRKFIKEAEDWLLDGNDVEGREELVDLYFEVMAFVKISEFFDERYVTFVDCGGRDVILKLFCLDPSYLLSEAVKRGKAAIFFSATLTPLDYFREILGGNSEDYTIRLPSPFDSKNLCLLVADKISTRYKDRVNSYNEVMESIKAMVEQRAGNYLAFFPSYEYMNEVFRLFTERYPYINILLQSSSMTEEEREGFLDRFQPDSEETLLGFAVMGGMFSEGIDLTGDRLSGAVIVSVGLPQMNPERDIIMNYFREKNGLGFEFAYMYPGMNKVLQAAGRVIRTETDTGTVLLVDERFAHSDYVKLFPREWLHNARIRSVKDIAMHLERFWRGDFCEEHQLQKKREKC